MLTSFKLLQFINAYSPIFFTPEGIIILLIKSLFSKAWLPISVTSSGIVISISFFTLSIIPTLYLSTTPFFYYQPAS